MSFKLKVLNLATLSIMLAACGGGSSDSSSNSTSSTSSNTNKLFDTAWYDVEVARFSANSNTSDGSTKTDYTYDIRSNSYSYDSSTNIISYTTKTLVGPTSLSFKKTYTATATQLLTKPATIASSGIPVRFLTNETANSVTVAPYNQEGIKTAALAKTTFKQTDISNTLISDVISEQVYSSTLNSNPHFLKVKNAGLKFPAGSVVLSETQYEDLESYIEFDTTSSFATISDFKAAVTLNAGESFVDELWANGAVKSSCIKAGAYVRGCVALYDSKVYFASYTAKQAFTDDNELYKYWLFNKTAADALNKAYKDNFLSETITTPTAAAAEAVAK